MAKWQRRVYRGLVAGLLGGVAATGWLIYQTTSSAAVRQQVIAHLRQRFTGAEVALGSAQLRLLGGITFSNLTLYRRDDPSQTPFLHVPEGIIHHDKEKLGQGRLVIQKIKFERPRVTAVRGANGQWNLSGILGVVRPDDPIPVFEIADATVVVDVAERDHEIASAPRTLEISPSRLRPSHHFEVREVNGTLLNHPKSVLNIELKGVARSFGPVTIRGTWRRGQEALSAAIDLSAVELGPTIHRELNRLCPGLCEPIEQLGGQARIQLDVNYQADVSPAWRHSVRAELQRGMLIHRALPMPIENIELSARCDEGQLTIERLTASSGPTEMTATARIDASNLSMTTANGGQSPNERTAPAAWFDPFQSLDFSIKHWPVNHELFDRLPASLAVYRQRFAPTGCLNATGRFQRTGATWSGLLSLRPADMTFRFESFPYPLRTVSGQLELALGTERPSRLDVNLAVEGGERCPVTIRGYVLGSGPQSEYAYELKGDGIPIDERLLQSLPGRFQNVARSFHPSGKCDIVASIHRTAGAPSPRQDYRVHVHDADVCYDVFPVPLSHATGWLDIHLPPGNPLGNRFTFRDFRAQRAGGHVTLTGSARPLANGTRIDLEVRGDHFPLDSALGLAFGRLKLRPLWDMFAPSGRMDFNAELSHIERPDAPPEFALRVAPQGATIRPSFFQYQLGELGGTFDITRTRVDIANVTARHGPTVLKLAGGSVRFADGGYVADLANLHAAPLPIDSELVSALPQALQSVFRSLDVRGSLAARIERLWMEEAPHLPGPASPPRFYWDGNIGFDGATLRTGVAWEDVKGTVACRGYYRGHLLQGVEGHIALENARVFGQPLSNLHARLFVDPKTPHELRLENIQAGVYGGRLGGEAYIAYGAGLQYRLDLKVVGAQLEEFARQNRLGNAQLSGPARAELYLAGAGPNADELEGAATIHVPQGRIYDLPLFLDLLKVIGLRSPDGTAFEEAHAELAIHGRRIEVQRLDLLGNAVSLGGRGEMNIDGSDLRLDFYAVWGHLVQLLPAGLREIPPWLSKNLFKITARGQLNGKVDYGVEPVPAVGDPVRQLLAKIQRRRGESAAERPLTYTPRLKGP
jgi:hypothetical protein